MMSKWVWLVESLVVFVLVWLLFYYLQFVTPWISGFDGYYHIKYAWLLRQNGILQEFPWAQFSLWRDNFSDKEFLFHVLLIPFTFFERLDTGAKHAAVVLAALFVVNFNLVLRLHRVPWRYLWVLLLLVAGDVLLYRLCLARPHLLSMIFMLWLVHATVRQRYGLLAALTAVYVHSYTAIHMPIVLGIIFCAGQWLMREKINWRLVFVPLLAVLLSSLVSPFFPNNLIVFYVQNLELAWQQLFWDINLYQGTELQPMSSRYLLTYNLPLLLPFGGALYLAILYPNKVSRETKHLLAMAAAFIVMMMFSKRFVEYSYPIGLLFCACYCRDRWGDVSWRAWWSEGSWQAAKSGVAKSLHEQSEWSGSKLKTAGCVLLILALVSATGVASYRNLYRDLRQARPSRYEKAAHLLQQNTPAKETIFTCDWDDAPELFYFNHHNHYMIFMDPLFMYSWSPQVWHMWMGVANGRLGERTAKVLFNDFKIKYGLCTNNFYRLREIVERDPNMRILYEDEHVYIFQVREPPAADADKEPSAADAGESEPETELEPEQKLELEPEATP